ncbi:tautomerase family protein [Streptomyces sp. N2-109]|uniref:Tautomerase family protein n=1 Tax=Streptomyces gossypii TaxID=2883101 RepID=A0ABT2K321_9ACTN|nr:tautomerase family protein [Streptomyces gossypii]MCT2594572.1 tautomerase family protein [Streptomyces gossypii]
MPQIEITIAEGRTPTQIRNVMHEVYAAVLRTVDTRPEYIRVVVHEVPRTHWATGDVSLTERDAASARQTGVTAGNQSDQDATRRPVPTAEEEQP